jgi:hypothetical protein
MLRHMTIINSSKKIKTLLLKTFKTQLTKVQYLSKKIKTLLIKRSRLAQYLITLNPI